MGRAEESIVRREALTLLFKKIWMKSLRTVIISFVICILGYTTSIFLKKPYPFIEPFFWISLGLVISLVVVLFSYILVLKKENYENIKNGIRTRRAEEAQAGALPNQLEVIGSVRTEHLDPGDIRVGAFVKGGEALKT